MKGVERERMRTQQVHAFHLFQSAEAATASAHLFLNAAALLMTANFTPPTRTARIETWHSS